MSNHYHPSRPSRTYSTPRAYLAFYTFLDALAFLMGISLGAFALGRFMHWFIYH
jgi:hypothetical protein